MDNINPIQFGELMAHVDNLRQRSTEQGAKLEAIDAKLDTLVTNIATRKGEDIQRSKYNAGVTALVAAVVSGGVAALIDAWKK